MQKIKQLQTKMFNIDLCVNDSIWDKELKSLKNKIPIIVDHIISELDIANQNNNIEFSIVLTNDNEIQKLNSEYLHKNKPTNVLSFPAQDFYLDNISPIFSLGDIVISYETLKKECIEKRISFNDHFTHLLIHGFLHLLGFDHVYEEEAERMENLEIAILTQLGIQSPYET